MRDAARRVGRWPSLVAVLLVVAIVLPFYVSDSLGFQGGLGLIAGEYAMLYLVVVLAATVPAAVVVSDRRDGLILLLRLRGLGPLGYLALRSGVAAMVASTLVVVALLVSLAGLVWLLGSEPSGVSPERFALPGAAPLLADLYTILVAAMAAGGLAAAAAVVGSVVQVPLVPNLVPLAAIVAAVWLADILPALPGELARIATVSLPAQLGHPTADVMAPLLVWPLIAVLMVAVAGPRQESLWRR
jgi:hypothetical protein